MKNLSYVAAAALLVAMMPAISFAQDSTGRTRADVQAELVQAQNASGEQAPGAAHFTGFGGSAAGSSQSSRSVNVPPAPGKTQRNPLGVYFGN